VIGRIERKNWADLPGEVLIEPLGLGTPGAYVARVVKRVLTVGELDKLKGLEGDCLGRNEEKSGTREVKAVMSCWLPARLVWRSMKKMKGIMRCWLPVRLWGEILCYEDYILGIRILK
jgi:hypothetical protein